jgi:hypothetical protein
MVLPDFLIKGFSLLSTRSVQNNNPPAMRLRDRNILYLLEISVFDPKGKDSR